MRVAVAMGSKSDLPVIQEAVNILRSFDIETVVDIVSTCHTPEKLMDSSINAHRRGFSIIVARAGGAAHLLNMLTAMSPLPAIGVPVKSSNPIDDWDSILSILQMPSGVPVAIIVLDGAKNAGILATQILASQQPAILDKIINYKESLKQVILTTVATLSDG